MGYRPFPRTPFSASRILPSLRSRQVSLDEAEHFLHNRDASVAYAPMVFGIILEWRSDSSRIQCSASPESPVQRVQITLRSYTQCLFRGIPCK
jgi:hypothetical protein